MAIDYSKLDGIPNLRVPSSATVIGIGGTGAWIALLAAISGVRDLTLFGMGPVKPTDLARIPFRPDQVGTNSAAAMAEVIRLHRPETAVHIHGQYKTAEHAHLLTGPVFIAANDKVVEFELPVTCKNMGLSFFHAVYELNSFGSFDHNPPSLKLCVDSKPNWAVPSAMAASLAIYSAFVAHVNFFGPIDHLSMSSDVLDHAVSSHGACN